MRSRNVNQPARDTDVAREDPYKALSADGNFSFGIVLRGARDGVETGGSSGDGIASGLDPRS